MTIEEENKRLQFEVAELRKDLDVLKMRCMEWQEEARRLQDELEQLKLS